MPRKELHSLIADLKQEIAHLREDQQGSHDQIESLISDLETHLSTGKSQDWPAEIAARLRDEVEQFETEHPQITATANNIMVLLGNMGI
jgi:hypothetical protein